MKVLELFSGNASFGTVCENEFGDSVDTVELDGSFCPSIVKDVYAFDTDGQYDIIWASPPCNKMSVLQIGRNWTKENTPRNKDALLSLGNFAKTLWLIDKVKPKYWFIENPVAKARRFLEFLPRYTVTYCAYGFDRRKPTDIWTNLVGWDPRPMCKNGDQCHQSHPRGRHAQWIRAHEGRALIPPELCRELRELCV